MVVIRLFNEAFSTRFRPIGLTLMLAGLLIWLGLVAASASLGSFNMNLAEVWQTVIGNAPSAQHELVVWEFRLPRTLVAGLVGALFALSGAMLQNLTRNSLADPSLVGISQGAALAVVTMVIVFPEVSGYWREVSAFAGSLLVALAIRVVAGKGNSLKFILMGIGMAALVSAITSAMLTYGDIDRAMSALAWLAGSINSATWSDVKILSVATAALLILYLVQARSMSPMSLGHEASVGLGVNINMLATTQLVTSVLAAALATAVVGPLGFVGLLAPHITRTMVKTGPANFLLLTALNGALLVLFADLVGRTLFAPVQIAAGLLTSLIGAPFFIWLMLSRKSQL
ncbi:FecCD family ABC transporter permease [Salinibius halmophilus]|uniref:FecCD family ABC transporter permease n=1 Tax=Salinibius halmophilus TaxID=1853216 RepID=UPI000E660743|nr:iron ABC transporter permease [Salinibius halmophilus]